MAADGAPGLRRVGVSTALFALLPLAVLALVATRMAGAPTVSFSMPWVPQLGVDLAFRLDGLATLMLALVGGIGLGVFVYAGGYFAGDLRRTRLLVLLSLFLVAMVGCVTADNLLLLFLFWELTSLLSFQLVGFHREQASARGAARQALLVTGGGGLCLLVGVLLLGRMAGTYSMSTIIERGPGLLDHPLLPFALGAVFIGCATKSAQFPFHFWLPNAMSAPTPVSAYLHSATMVKLGIYLLARLDPAFGDWPGWELTLVPLGSLTATWAMVLALRERDLKRILAWSTVGSLGTLVLLIGLPGDGAAVAVACFLLAHALYKAPLFFVAGNVDHGTGTRVIDRLGMLRRQMPFTALAAALAGVSMAGLPLSFGFLAKAAMKSAKLEAETHAILLAVAQSSVFVGAVGVAVAAVAAVRIFWRHPGVNETPVAHEVGPAMFVPPVLIAGFGMLCGVWPQLVEPLLTAAAVDMTPGPHGPVVQLGIAWSAVWATIAVTLIAGIAVFANWDRLHALLGRVTLLERLDLARGFESLLKALPEGAARLTRRLQHGRLPGYFALLFGAAVIALGALGVLAGLPSLPPWETPDLVTVGAALTLCTGAVLACFVGERLPLLLASGLVGYGSALLFLFAGAPDLAFTQFAVETVFVIVAASLLLKLRRLHSAVGLPGRRLRPVALLLALGFGTLMATLLLAVNAVPLDPALADWFNAHALADAHGLNVVNVIIVDFRGLDTLGEISVVIFSLLAAWPLLAALRTCVRAGSPAVAAAQPSARATDRSGGGAPR